MLFIFFSQTDEPPVMLTFEVVATKAAVVAARMVVAEIDVDYTVGDNTSGGGRGRFRAAVGTVGAAATRAAEMAADS